MNVENTHDTVNPAQLTERVTVSWSQPRCWHGDDVTIRVRTERVTDGYMIQLQVLAQGAANHFHQLANQPITGNKLDVPYTLNWKTLLPQPPPYPTQVQVRATVVGLNNVTALSDPMAVDLIPPLHSA
ncbi:MAG TPA: hypothetical protein VFA65_18780 [Bryobacteraceae bacterium]|nr:hypothetical protein [Bryobacteraceae bacterium]